MEQDMHDTKPWWTFGYVWLVLAGPIIVVIASLHTFWLAASMPDPVLDTSVLRHSEAPAQQARNHAQTGAPVAGRSAASAPATP
ncbi:nitrogen fixation protein FixH [Hylemonella gracilis]|uniref:Nitrogen fixation protein FixH n=2 Tax=Hylemonella gracilis TaxID=80880 RepID=A0A4V1A2M1_9BURK|nr:nitrogen fixation protein FixH [Hylemonella gracilis]